MIARLLAAALVMLLPAAAAADGKHGGSIALGATGSVAILGYRVELLSEPGPLARGEQTHVVAKVVADPLGIPVPGGVVMIGFAAPGEAHDLKPAPELTWAGSYALAITPERTGPHRVRVVLAELEGRRVTVPGDPSSAAFLTARASSCRARISSSKASGSIRSRRRSRTAR